jgi:glutamyl-tRNA synthetase
MDEKARRLLDEEGRRSLARLREILAGAPNWAAKELEERARTFAEGAGLKLGVVAQPLRAALTGSTVSPGIFEVAEALGRDEALGRIDDAVAV